MAGTNSSHHDLPPGGRETAQNDAGLQIERRGDLAARDALVNRVLSEFREMPCMRLTPEQAQRLFGLHPDVSRRIIDTLIQDGHVRRDADGRLVATKS